MRISSPLAVFLTATLSACGTDPGEGSPDAAEAETAAPALTWETLQDSTHRVAVVTGLAGPEAVRYDPDQDVWFVANFNGDGGERDGNGFVSRVSADGVLEVLEFMTGTEETPFHAGRGMNIIGDTLWVADVDGVHGFHRETGEPLAFIDFTALAPGFLNDIEVGPDGALYVTDTGASVVYRAAGSEISVASTIPEEGRPNGITWDPTGNRFLTVPWGGGQTLFAFSPETGETEVWSQATGGYFDGIELVGSRALVASQADSAIHVVEGGTSRPVIRVGGSPADIGVDRVRSRVAVPYISLDRVDIWQVPEG